MDQRILKYREIAPCILAIIIDALGFGLVYPIMTAIFTAHHSPVLPVDVSLQTRHFYLGLGFMLYPLCMFFGTSFMGDLSDNYGRKKVLMICMGGIAASFSLMALGIEFASVWLLMLGRALSGLMAGSQPIAQAAIADLSTPETKAKNMSMITLSYCFGSVLGPLLGGITSDPTLVHWFSFSMPLFLAAALALIAFIWIVVSFKETFSVHIKRKISFLRPIHIFYEAAKHPSIRILAIVFLLMQIGFSIYFQFIIVQMRYANDYSNWQLGAVQAMIGLGFALGLLVCMPYSLKRWQVISIAIGALLFTGIGQIFASLNYIVFIQWILAIAIASLDIMAFTALLTLFSDAVEPNAQGWVMGIANAVMAISWAVSGLFSNLITMMGTRGLIFMGGICLIVSSIILGKYFYKGKSAAKFQ